MSSSRLAVRDLSYRDRSRSPGRAGGRADTRVPEPIEMSLERVRILIQDHETDPFEAPPLLSTSRTFRVAVFALNFGLCMLESPRGRAGLVAVGRDIANAWGRRDRRGMAFYRDRGVRGGVDDADSPEAMRRAVDRFLRLMRADPPNVVVSTRVPGDAMVERIGWFEGESQRYSAKEAAMFRLNHHVCRPPSPSISLRLVSLFTG